MPDDESDPPAHVIPIKPNVSVEDTPEPSEEQRGLVRQLLTRDKTLGAIGVETHLKEDGHEIPLAVIERIIAEGQKADHRL